jgi:3-oxoacyl-[acyl-carrier-protein] synthase III
MLYIHGIGHCHPDNIICNQFLESLNIDTNNQWIVDRVGINERRTVLPLDYIRSTYNKTPSEGLRQVKYTTAQAGAKAARMALERAGLTTKDIGMIIGGSSSPRYSVPAESCCISSELGINVPTFDVNSGCATFTIHMNLVNNMQQESLPDYILMVIPDHITRSVNFSDRRTAVLFGDCTTAIIVSKKMASKYRTNYTFMDSAPMEWEKIKIPTGGHAEVDGQSVQKFAIRKTIDSLKVIQNKTSYNPLEHYFIGHQANLSMLRFVCKNMSIPADKHLYNVDKYGNCGGASAPSVLSEHWDQFKSGDEIGLVVVGAGLTWGGMHISVS